MAERAASAAAAPARQAAAEAAEQGVSRASQRAAAIEARSQRGLVARGSSADDGARAASQVLGRELTETQSAALHRAHLLPSDDLAGKAQTLAEGGLDYGERQMLMRLGVAGEHSPAYYAQEVARYRSS